MSREKNPQQQTRKMFFAFVSVNPLGSDKNAMEGTPTQRQLQLAHFGRGSDLLRHQ